MSDVGAELGYILPFEDLANFPRLFKQLDEQLADLKVSSYGVAITTLEDVFLKVSQLSIHVQSKLPMLVLHHRSDTHTMDKTSPTRLPTKSTHSFLSPSLSCFRFVGCFGTTSFYSQSCAHRGMRCCGVSLAPCSPSDTCTHADPAQPCLPSSFSLWYAWLVISW